MSIQTWLQATFQPMINEAVKVAVKEAIDEGNAELVSDLALLQQDFVALEQNVLNLPLKILGEADTDARQLMQEVVPGLLPTAEQFAAAVMAQLKSVLPFPFGK